MRKLKADEVTFAVTMEPDIDVPLEGNVLSSGSTEEDQKAEKWVRDQLNAGNDWAWCWVKVTAVWKCFEGDDSMGCISCEGEEQFNEVFLPEMREIALHNLNEVLAQAKGYLEELEYSNEGTLPKRS